MECFSFYAPPFSMGVVGDGGHIVSPLSIHTSVPYVTLLVSV